MKRDEFIHLTALTTGISVISNGFSNTLTKLSGDSLNELSQHAIDKVEFTDIQMKYPRLVGKNAQLDVHGYGPNLKVGILRTDKGAEGWGMLQADGAQLKRATKYIHGKRISSVFNPDVGVTDNHVLAFDIALHDLAGIILEKPVYELLGRRSPFVTNCYSGMIYFDDLEPTNNPSGIEKIRQECEYDYGLGYRQFKLKIGRGNKWMPKEKGMKRDIEVTRMVADQFPDCKILVDVNNGYSLEEMLTYSKE